MLMPDCEDGAIPPGNGVVGGVPRACDNKPGVFEREGSASMPGGARTAGASAPGAGAFNVLADCPSSPAPAKWLSEEETGGIGALLLEGIDTPGIWAVGNSSIGGAPTLAAALSPG